MVEIRTFRLGNGSCVVAVSGELDGAAAAEVDAEIALRAAEGYVVLDLLNVRWARARLDRIDGGGVMVVGEPHVLDRLQLTGGVRVASSLASALR